jgi:hypothetical protein
MRAMKAKNLVIRAVFQIKSNSKPSKCNFVVCNVV